MNQGYTYQPKQITTQQEKPKPTTGEKYFIWHIQGGLGKNIAGTALIKEIKTKYPDRKLIMVTSWPEVFLNNPDVDRIFQLGQSPYFYESIIFCENLPKLWLKHIWII